MTQDAEKKELSIKNEHSKAEALYNDVRNAMNFNGKLIQVYFQMNLRKEDYQRSKVVCHEDGLLQIWIDAQMDIDDIITEWCKCYYNNIDKARKLRAHYLNPPCENIKFKNLIYAHNLVLH